MSYTRLPHGRNTYGVDEFIVDTVKEVKTLPTAGTPGSKAIVANDGGEYILNNKHQWVPYAGGSSGGGTVTQAQIDAAVETALENKDLISSSDLTELEARVTAQETINTNQQEQIDNFSWSPIYDLYDSSQAGQILVINNEGRVEPQEVTAVNGFITTTQTGQHIYEVSRNTGRGEDGAYLYECTSSDWSSFSIRDAEQVKFTWNRLSYTVYVTADGEDFIVGSASGSDPYIIFTHRQDLGVNKLIAKVYQPTPSSIKDYTLKVITGIPQDTDNLVLRANGSQYRLYINSNGELQVARIN